MRLKIAHVVVALLVGSNAANASTSRLPDWVSIAQTFGTKTDAVQANLFPSAESRAQWEREGHGFVDLLWRIQIHIERSGMIKTRIEIVRHFVSESGISQGGNMDIWADAWRDQLTLETGYSISSETPPAFVDPETIEVISGPVNGVFSDFQQIVLPIPGLRVGSNAVIAGNRRFQSADMPLDWAWLTSIGSNVPIKRFEVEVSREDQAPEFMWRTNDDEFHCEEVGRKLSCSRSDIPAIRLDQNVASYVDLMPHFFVGGVQTWRDVQENVGALVEKSATLTPELRDVVRALDLDSAGTDREKFWKLLRFAADEIRYVSLAHGDATVVPHPASVTLSRRYGDCKDKVTVLVAMGRAAGLDIYPVLTSSDRKDKEKLLRPSSNYFDHMIACMEDGDGNQICVDPTQAYSGLELPPQLFDAVALPIKTSTVTSIENLTGEAIGWEIQLQRSVRLEKDESVNVRDVRRYLGPGAAGIRTQLLALSRADRVDSSKREYRDSHGGSTTPNFTFRSLSDPTKPFEIEFSTKQVGGYQLDAGEFYRFDPWLTYYARAMISTNRHHPYRLLGIRYVAEETVDHCCASIDFAGPDLAFATKFGSLQRSSEIVDGKLTMRTVFELPSAVIPPQEIPELEAFILESVAETMQWVSWRSGR